MLQAVDLTHETTTCQPPDFSRTVQEKGHCDICHTDDIRVTVGTLELYIIACDVF